MMRATQPFSILCIVIAGAVGCGAPSSPTQTRGPSTPPAPSAVTAAPAAVAATGPAPYGTAAQLAGWIDAYVAGFGSEWGPAAKPNGYLIVAKDGVPVVERAYGKAFLATGAAPGPDTGFRIGSVTKQVTAVAVLQLVERKRLATTDGVRKLLPELPSSFEPITIRNLLTHTSGIANFTDDESLSPKKGHIARARVIAAMTAAPPAFPPGERFDYSNSNYYLLGMIIEKVSGTTYEDYLQKNIFGPAGMKHSTAKDKPNAPDYADGQTVDASDHIVPIDADVFDNGASLPFAAGAIRSTAHDLVLWDRALVSGALLNAESERFRTTPVNDDYACGVAISTEAGHRVEAHSGGIWGFSSHMTRIPDLGIVVAFLGNSDSFEAASVAKPVVKMVLTGRAIPPEKEPAVGVASPKVLSSIAGEYALTETSRADAAKKLPKAVFESIVGMTAKVEDGRISLKPTGQPWFVIFPAKESADGTTFFTKTSHIDVSVTVDKSGKVTSARLLQAGMGLDYARR